MCGLLQAVTNFPISQYPEAAAALDEDMDTLDANATWELIPLPKDENTIGCKWTYKVKHNPNGSMSRRKVLLVVDGYS